MAFQKVANTAEVTIIYGQNAELMANTFHAQLSTGYDFADIAALADAVDAAVGAQLLPVMSHECDYDRTEVRGLDTENDLADTEDFNNGQGLIVQEGLPNSVTFCIKKQSGLTGRSARGRWYFVGMPTTYLSANENIIGPTSETAMVLAVEGIRQAVQATAWSPVIVSRYSGGVLREFGETFPWISVVSVDPFVDTQRRRLSG